MELDLCGEILSLLMNQPIDQTIITKLRPTVIKLLNEMNVQYAEYNDNTIVFDYLDLKVTLSVKSKVRKQ